MPSVQIQDIIRNKEGVEIEYKSAKGEKAGSGADIILKGWKDNNWEQPEIIQLEEPQRVELTLKMPLNQSIGTKQGLNRDQVETKTGLSWSIIEKILTLTTQPISSSEIRNGMHFANATKFKQRYLNPLLSMQLIKMTKPNSPTSPYQQYVLTSLGKSLLE